jgi:hypothetical protein
MKPKRWQDCDYSVRRDCGYIPKAWEEAFNILIGLYLLASPWALRYTDQARPTMNAVLLGLLVTMFAIWAMLMDTAVQRWWHERHVTR